jgi:hypothetical protein
MNRLTIPAALSAALLLSPVYSITAAAEFTAPSDIELSMGSAELDRTERGGDELVEIPIYISNNPGFISLAIIFRIDDRLSYDSDYAAEAEDNGLSGVSMRTVDDGGKVLMTCFNSHGSERYKQDGRIGTLRVRVPADIGEGIYGISFLEAYSDNDLQIFTYNNREAVFGAECFSVLEGASITVRTSVPEPPAQKEQAQGNGQGTAGQSSGESVQPAAEAAPAGTGTEAPAKTTTEAVTAAAETTVITTKVTKAATSAKITSSAGTSVMINTSASATTETEAETDRTETRKKGDLIIPVLIATLIAVGGAMSVALRRRR